MSKKALGLMVFKKIKKRACLGQMEKPIKYWLREKMDFDQALKRHVLAHIRSIFFTFQSLGRGYIKRQSKFQSKTLFSQFLGESYPSKHFLKFVGLVSHIKQRFEILLLDPSSGIRATRLVSSISFHLLVFHFFINTSSSNFLESGPSLPSIYI
ncbi:hypothetical protein YC2023_049673 [Brassica napus]